MQDETKKIALLGNPNVGKSTVFNSLTGMKQHTGNWPGKTVDCSMGRYEHKGKTYDIYDLPGTYSLIPHSKEEEVVRDFICYDEYDAIVVVCDAVCLERNLNLALQVMSVCKNVVICVNLMDEAEKKMIKIDLNGISKELNVPVIGMVARSKIGLEDLKDVVQELISRKNVKYVNEFCTKVSDENTTQFVRRAEEICSRNITFEKSDYNKKDRKIDKILTSKLTGIPIMLLLLGLVFWITLSVANYPSSMLFELFSWLGEKITNSLSKTSLPIWFISALMDGIYRVLTWVVSVMLPPMAIFFPLFTILEDLGYLPRIAFNLDNTFKKCKACGKQALTMCMGFGCNACGVTGCRIIDSPRERLIAILTNNFVPCNGRFPTMISIISMFFVFGMSGIINSITGVLLLMLVILIGIGATFLFSKILSETILKGEASSFTLELPPYRTPEWGKVIVRSLLDRTLFVLGRAVVVAAPAGLLIWILANVTISDVSILNYCTDFLDTFARLMGLDGVILMAFILGFPANEIVFPIILMTYMSTGKLIEMNSIVEMREVLIANGWTYVTAICTMMFSLMHWPCSTTCLTIKKETGSLKWTAVSVILPTLCGILVCMAINFVTYLCCPNHLF